MITVYDALLGIDEQTFDKLASVGLMRSNAKRDLQIYSYYLNELIRVGSMQGITNTSIEFSLSEDRIQSIIYQLQKRLK